MKILHTLIIGILILTLPSCQKTEIPDGMELHFNNLSWIGNDLVQEDSYESFVESGRLNKEDVLYDIYSDNDLPFYDFLDSLRSEVSNFEGDFKTLKDECKIKSGRINYCNWGNDVNLRYTYDNQQMLVEDLIYDEEYKSGQLFVGRYLESDYRNQAEKIVYYEEDYYNAISYIYYESEISYRHINMRDSIVNYMIDYDIAENNYFSFYHFTADRYTVNEWNDGVYVSFEVDAEGNFLRMNTFAIFDENQNKIYQVNYERTEPYEVLINVSALTEWDYLSMAENGTCTIKNASESLGTLHRCIYNLYEIKVDIEDLNTLQDTGVHTTITTQMIAEFEGDFLSNYQDVFTRNNIDYSKENILSYYLDYVTVGLDETLLP